LREFISAAKVVNYFHIRNYFAEKVIFFRENYSFDYLAITKIMQKFMKKFRKKFGHIKKKL